MVKTLSFIAAGLLVGQAYVQSPGCLWWEAERPAATNFPPARKGDTREQQVLSGGLWIGVEGQHGAGRFLEYEIELPAAGEYDFFVRKFWKHGPFRYRFDEQDWREVGRDCTLLDGVEMRTHWVANWVPAGTVKLDAGRHRLRIEVLQESGVAFFDAFLLTSHPFSPRGKFKPDEPFPPAPEGWVNFDPGIDTFDETPIDLRYLNEAVAGENGFIAVEGESFVQGLERRPIKFWAVNAGPAVVDMPRRYVDQLARFLAKRGVNLVRYHGPIYIQNGPDAGKIDQARLDNLFYFIAAMKREGVYTHLSIHFQHWLRLNELQQFAGYDAQTLPFAIHFFNPDFQRMYRSWWEALLTSRSPHIGRPLVDEPAVMGLELLNEDSLFFWTFDYRRIPREQMQILEKQFAQWLTQKYGSLRLAMAAWGGRRLKEDALEDGRVAFVDIWQMGNVRDARCQDTVRFLGQVQRRFFDDSRDHVRSLGFKGAICASNWITGSANYLEPIDTWTNLGADFMNHHGYFDRPWKKNVQAFPVQMGDQYADRALVRLDPAKVDGEKALDLPFLDVVHDGKPSMVSEYAWVNPNRYRAEMALFSSALASLTGMDAMVLFSLHSVPQWRGTETAEYWPIQTPAELGQFPAAAVIFRKQLVREADVVASVNVNLEDMFSLKGAPARTNRLGDFVRAAEGRQESKSTHPAVENALLAIGKVRYDYNEDPSRAQLPDLARWLDSREGVITSANGETRWEYRRGIFAVTAPAAQGATGFLKSAGTVELPSMSISSDMEFGSIIAVSLDDRPLSESRRILLQLASEQRNTGWEVSEETGGLKTIRSVGTMPIQYREFSGTVRFAQPVASVRAFDFNGREVKKLPAGQAVQLDRALPYYLLER